MVPATRDCVPQPASGRKRPPVQALGAVVIVRLGGNDANGVEGVGKRL